MTEKRNIKAYVRAQAEMAEHASKEASNHDTHAADHELEPVAEDHGDDEEEQHEEDEDEFDEDEEAADSFPAPEAPAPPQRAAVVRGRLQIRAIACKHRRRVRPPTPLACISDGLASTNCWRGAARGADSASLPPCAAHRGGAVVRADAPQRGGGGGGAPEAAQRQDAVDRQPAGRRREAAGAPRLRQVTLTPGSDPTPHPDTAHFGSVLRLGAGSPPGLTVP